MIGPLPNARWIRHGVLNTLEHGITRVADSLSSMVLLWVLAPEVFSRLALAQAIVAPFLLLFISPENVLYRDYALWKTQGLLESKIRAFQLFAWGKTGVALVLSVALAWALNWQEMSLMERFAALFWAFCLALAPQVSGPDREFLRLDLQLERLNLLTLLQKGILLSGTVVVAWVSSTNIVLYSGVAFASLFFSAALASVWSRKGLRKSERDVGMWRTIGDSLGDFSFWQHVSGVVMNWVRTMDLLILGWFGAPARALGLYGAVLKFANLAAALPVALSNMFSVGLGRAELDATRGGEIRKMFRYSLVLGLLNAVQGAVIFLLTPWILEFFSHGRWTQEEMQEMTSWMGWILLGTVIFSSTHFISSWLTLRQPMLKQFLWVSLPCGLLGFGAYAWAYFQGGIFTVAQANVWVALGYSVLLLLFFTKTVKMS